MNLPLVDHMLLDREPVLSAIVSRQYNGVNLFTRLFSGAGASRDLSAHPPSIAHKCVSSYSSTWLDLSPRTSAGIIITSSPCEVVALETVLNKSINFLVDNIRC